MKYVKPSTKNIGPMNLREFWNHVGTDNILTIIDKLDSSYAYFRQMRYGFKKPSGTMAMKIITVCTEVTGCAPDLALLIEGCPRARVDAPRSGRKLQPSPSFLRERKATAVQ